MAIPPNPPPSEEPSRMPASPLNTSPLPTRPPVGPTATPPTTVPGWTAYTGATTPLPIAQPKTGKRAFRLMVALAGILAALVTGIWLFKMWLSPPMATAGGSNPSMFSLPSFPVLRDDMVVLLMGVDHNQPGRRRLITTTDKLFEGARTDTMLLVRLSPRNNTISVVSLPRDSKVYLANAARVGKLNSAFSMGGANFAKAVVEYSFGIPVQHTAAIHLEGIREVVDALGGVDVTIDKPMHYRDWTDGLRINFDPGRHHLSGDEALGYLRFRHDALADIGRIRRQQYFLTSLKSQLAQPASLLKLPGVLESVQPYIQTDLDQGQMMAVANFIRQVPSSNIRIATLPGYASTRESASYWIINPYDAKQMLNRMLYNLPSTEAAMRQGEPLKVGILYPRGAEAVAQDYVKVLEQSEGYKVTCRRVSKRPASLIAESSFRVRDEDTARLQKLLPGAAKWPVMMAPNNATYEQLGCDGQEDYTVVIGLDKVAPQTGSL